MEKSIQTSKKTHARLQAYMQKNESYGSVLNRLMDVYDEWERAAQ